VSELRELRHELGNTLATVSLNMQYLLRRLPSWADRRERRALVAIRDGLLRAGRLLRPAPGGVPPSRCDLQTVVALALSQVPPERAPDLLVRARTETPMIGCGHPERIVQVLANLLDNAVKYSLPGTPIEVELSRMCDWAGDSALIIVRDLGIGIDAEVIDTVFAGTRTAAARRTAPGSGLGLEVSRQLIEAEGGRFWVTGMPGCGSTFYAQLPIAPLVAAESAPVADLVAAGCTSLGVERL
jgi:signal transduction histidine kinase